MTKIRVLHITPWFPHDDDPSRTVYIRRHIDSLAPFVDQHVLHLDMDKKQFSDISTEEMTIVRLNPVFDLWRWKEWAFCRELKKQLIQLDAANQFTHVNFHIAYPSLVFYDRIKHLLPKKVCIIEHWSIYHYNFFSKNRPHRLSGIFQNNIPILAVSNALRNDLLTFSGNNLQIDILPNVVDDEIFQFQNCSIGNHFFMAALWKSPKDPIVVLEEITHLRSESKIIHLRIAGDGPLLPSMKQFVKNNDLHNQVLFLGQLSSSQIADELNRAQALLLPTHYETFSVITAEALACGCPVIADNVGAIPELLVNTNGVLRSTTGSWSEAIAKFEAGSYDRKSISFVAKTKFSAEVIGQRYFHYLQQL